MQNLKRINYLNLALYGLFICFNLLEIGWNGYTYSLGNKLIILDRMGSLNKFMQIELGIHTILNFVSLAVLIAFLLFCNRMTKKNDLGKSFHFLLILLGFFPIASLFLYYIIWRRLNQNLFKHFGVSYKESDRIIVGTWVLELSYRGGAIFFWIAGFYSNNPEFVSKITYLKELEPLIHSVYLLVVSVLYFLYYLNFHRGILKSQSGIRDLIKNDLID
jgi:hypothetical protein